jgi:hypothetical protein
MTSRVPRLGLVRLASLCAVVTSSVAEAQQASPPPTQGPPPPAYYTAPMFPAPSQSAPAQPNAYPVSPRDYGAGPDTLGFREGMFVPPGYHLSHRPHRAVLVSGVSLLAGAYLLGLTAGALDGFDNQKGWLFLPVAGPWLASSQRHGCDGSSFVTCKVNDSSATVLLAIDGLAQGAGAFTMLLAIAIQEKVLVRNDAQVIVLPSAVAGGAGMTAYGRF